MDLTHCDLRNAASALNKMAEDCSANGWPAAADANRELAAKILRTAPQLTNGDLCNAAYAVATAADDCRAKGWPHAAAIELRLAAKILRAQCGTPGYSVSPEKLEREAAAILAGTR